MAQCNNNGCSSSAPQAIRCSFLKKVKDRRYAGRRGGRGVNQAVHGRAGEEYSVDAEGDGGDWDANGLDTVIKHGRGGSTRKHGGVGKEVNKRAGGKAPSTGTGRQEEQGIRKRVLR